MTTSTRDGGSSRGWDVINHQFIGLRDFFTVGAATAAPRQMPIINEWFDRIQRTSLIEPTFDPEDGHPLHFALGSRGAGEYWYDIEWLSPGMPIGTY